MADMEDDDAMFGGDDDMEEEEEDDDDVIIPTSSSAIKTETTENALLHLKEEENIAHANNVTPTSAITVIPGNSNKNHQLAVLPTSLPTTSPFPHHNAGPTSDRLRNAMSRITSNPTRDAEAWQALITEAQSCYRTLLPSLHLLKTNNGGFAAADDNINNSIENAESVSRKFDWIEGCYGALLHYFPYAISHYVQLVEMLLRLSALTIDEEEQCGQSGGGGATMASLLGSGADGSSSVGGGGSALSDPVLTTTDQGVAISPSALLMHPVAASGATDRQRLCEHKIDNIFRLCLGINPDGSPALHGKISPNQSIDVSHATGIDGAKTIMGGLARHSVDLWLLYVRKRSRDAARSAAIEVVIPPSPPGYVPGLAQQPSVLHRQYDDSLRSAYRERKEKIRDVVVKAYEAALDRGAGFSTNNHLIWRRYVNYVKSWTDVVNYNAYAHTLLQWYPPGSSPTLPPPDPAYDQSTTQKQLNQLRSIYQRGITHPMTGLDQYWQEYEMFERSHSEALGSVMIAEWLPRYQHARSVYLERNRVWTLRELMAGRLAVPPVGCEDDGVVGGGGGGGTGGSTSRTAPGGGTTTTTTLDADDEDHGGTGQISGGMLGGSKPTLEAELVIRMEDEIRTLSRWRRRAAYERTNPERLSSSELAMRVRASFAEEVCAFARHPEVWYEWSQWELLHGGSTAASSSTTTVAVSNGVNGAAISGGGGTSAASSAALIAPVVAGEWKSGGNALRAIAVLTLGMEMLSDCALLAVAQAEILERHLSGTSDKTTTTTTTTENDNFMGGCIDVLEKFVHRSPTTLGFVLLQRLVRRHRGIHAARAVFGHARRTLRVREEDRSFDDEKESSATSAASSEKKDDTIGLHDAKDKNENGVIVEHRIVTNRLNAFVGVSHSNGDKYQSPVTANNAGFITWHLYMAHAIMEHRLGKNPKVAARVYELGLRKHRTFLSNPPYVLHYANLLLELNDEENLRSLLMRAVAACEEEEAVTSASIGGSDTAVIARRREMQRPLWDMMLKFESILCSHSNKGNIAADISSIEARRRRALYGPNNEDVVMGGEGSPDDDDDRNLGTGIQKSSLNEQLIRVEGYDVASRIANGMGRLVDVLTVTGAIGNGEFDSSSKSIDFAAAASASLAAGGVSYDLWGDECAGGPSDVSYVKRLRFQRESRTRAAVSALGFGGINQGTAGKLLTSRQLTAGAAGQASANSLALQSSPDWLRPLLLILPPVPKFGKSTVKPPPHLTEMALSTLRANPLPASRPVVMSYGNSNKKRGRDGGDSSDDDDGDNVGGGYSNQFRARQRTRLLSSNTN